MSTNEDVEFQEKLTPAQQFYADEEAAQEENKSKEKREPSLFLALLPVISLVFFLGGGYIVWGLPVEPLLILAAVIAGFVAIYLGYSWQDIIDSVAAKIAKTMPAILILITVGLLIGTWMAGGTIPMLIYYGLLLIDPRFLAVIALVVTAIVSLCTGTSWGSAGTIGVAFMGVALGMGANPAVVAGAVVAGAYFGDKLSPLSDTTNIASLAVGVNLFVHIRHLLWTTLPAFLVSATVYLIYGFTIKQEGEVPQRVTDILTTLDTAFQLHGWYVVMLLLPVIIVLGGSMMKLPTIPVMLLSGFVAAFNAIALQKIAFIDTVNAAVNGFNTEMVTSSAFDHENIIEDVTKLLDRGGMNSMMGTLLICFCAITFAGVISVTPSLNILIEHLLRIVKSTFGLIVATIITGVSTIGITSNGQVSLLIPGEMLREAYIRRGLHPKNLSRTIEDSVTVIEPILPWTAAGAYMAGTLGVATIEYLPWAVSNWIAIGFALLWGLTGIGIEKLPATKEEKYE